MSRPDVRRRLLLALMIFAGVFSPAFLSGSAAGSVPVYRTVVSLTFDDGRASQATAGALLSEHGMHATFYLNSGSMNTSGYLTWDQAHVLAAAGNEIGGHTVNHVHLPLISLSDAQYQICQDFTNLVAEGFTPISFAYPFGESNTDIEALVAGCGYTSARITQGILGSAPWCDTAGCPTAETIPPLDSYGIRATGSVTNATTLAQLESFVISAEENGGGWVPFVFHDIGPGTDNYWISESEFAAFLDWLSTVESNGVIVRTVGEVMSGDANPPETNLLQNPSFEAPADAGLLRDCWETVGSDWTAVGDPHSGSLAVRGDFSVAAGTDPKLIVERSSSCAAPVLPGRHYRLSGWYKGSLSPSFVVYWQHASGSWDSSPAMSKPSFPVSAGAWHKAAWITPVAPSDAVGVSVGFLIAGSDLGDITIDDLSLGDAAGTPPDVQISAPAAGSYVSGSTAALSANAVDADGVQSVEFFVDDQPVGVNTSPPYSVSWNSTTVAEAAHTLTVLATDQSGAQSYDSLSFVVDNTNPTGNLTTPASGSILRRTVTLESDSSDSGSGVASVNFERSPSGSPGTWTAIDTDTSSPYSASWNTAAAADGSWYLRVVTTDKAGNSYESNPPVLVSVDNTAPDVSIVSEPSDPTNSTAASFAFTSVDPSARFLCSLDGAAYARCVSPQEHAGLAEGAHAFSVEAIDPAGNVGGAAVRRWLIDNTPPTGSLVAPAHGSFVRRTVTLRSDSSDSGSGVKSVSFQIAPLMTREWRRAVTVTTAPWEASLNLAYIRYRRFLVRVITRDRAGNEFVSALRKIKVDNAVPTSSITCSGRACRGVFSKPVRVKIEAHDLGSGVRTIRYTLNGGNPTSSSRPFEAPFSLATTATIRWRVWDEAGNASRVRSRVIRRR